MRNVVSHVRIALRVLHVNLVHQSLLVHKLEAHLLQGDVLHILIRKNLIIII